VSIIEVCIVFGGLPSTFEVPMMARSHLVSS
jgi:hypothetical protein